MCVYVCLFFNSGKSLKILSAKKQWRSFCFYKPLWVQWKIQGEERNSLN